jgi:hypothetical protein
MPSLSVRLARLEKRHAAPTFSPWQLLWGQQPPAGWAWPEEWLALLATRTAGAHRIDPYEEAIQKAWSYVASDQELAERLRQLEQKVQEARNDPTRNGNSGGPA